MKPSERRFALLVLLSMLLHTGGYWGWSKYLGLAAPKAYSEKMIVVTLQSKPEQIPPVVIDPDPIKKLEKEPDIAKTEESEAEVEAPKPVEKTESKHNMFSNAEQNASNNQTIKGKTEVAGFGMTIKEQKPKRKLEATEQVKTPEPKKNPVTISQNKEILDAVDLVEVKDSILDKDAKKVIKQTKRLAKKSVKEGEVKAKTKEKKEKKLVKRIIAASTEQTNVSSLKDASTGKSKKNIIVKEDVEQAPKAQLIAKLEPDILEIMTGKVTSKGIDKSEKVDLTLHFKEGVGDMKILSDSSLRGAKVKQPYSKIKSKELERVNIFLEKMEKQLRALWVNPYKGRELHQGTIKLELNENGYLQNVYVYRSSGIPKLDESFENAIRSVARFDVPTDKKLANQYYRNLTFHYSSIKIESEPMPFELER